MKYSLEEWGKKHLSTLQARKLCSFCTPQMVADGWYFVLGFTHEIFIRINFIGERWTVWENPWIYSMELSYWFSLLDISPPWHQRITFGQKINWMSKLKRSIFVENRERSWAWRGYLLNWWCTSEAHDISYDTLKSVRYYLHFMALSKQSNILVCSFNFLLNNKFILMFI